MNGRFGFDEFTNEELEERLELINRVNNLPPTSEIFSLVNLDDPVQIEGLTKMAGFYVPQGQNWSIDRVEWRKLEFAYDQKNGFHIRYSRKRQSSANAAVPSNDAELNDLLVSLQSECDDPGVTTAIDPEILPSLENETSLSIGVEQEESVLVVLTLPEGASYRFNRDGAPFSTIWTSLEKFGGCGILDASDEVKNYNRVNGNLKDKNDLVRTAYFVITSLKDQSVAFNIHLDLVGKKKRSSETAEQEEYFIPVIVDPEVRHPG